MFKQKIFELLKSLSAEEFERLGDFIASPYFNKTKNVAVLYKYISPHYPHFNDEALTKENIYKKVFKLEEYKDSSVRNVISKLLNVTQMFLVIENLKKEKLTGSNLLLEELLRRDQEELFMKNLKGAEMTLSRSKEVDFDYLLNRYKLERNKFNFNVSKDKIVNKQKVYPHLKTLNDAGTYLSIYYVTELISENANVILYGTNFNTGEELESTVSAILNAVDLGVIYSALSSRNECAFLMEIYIALLEAFRDLDNDNKYFYYKELIGMYSDRLSHDEISFHYSILMSCLILKEKLKGYSPGYSREQLQLFDIILSGKYFRNKKELFLPVKLYRDALFLKLRMCSPVVVKALIDGYTNKIHPNERANMYNFSNAFYYFELKEYGISLEHINRIKLDYFIYKYDLKNLLLRVYFELGYFEEAISLIHSYRELLRKDDFLSDKRKTRLRNFVKYLQRLMILLIDKKTAEIESLKLELDTLEEISYKGWLAEKFDSIVTVA